MMVMVVDGRVSDEARQKCRRPQSPERPTTPRRLVGELGVGECDSPKRVAIHLCMYIQLYRCVYIYML